MSYYTENSQGENVRDSYLNIVLYISGVYASFMCGCLEYRAKTRGWGGRGGLESFG